jgi:hypothetical protein
MKKITRDRLRKIIKEELEDEGWDVPDEEVSEPRPEGEEIAPEIKPEDTTSMTQGAKIKEIADKAVIQIHKDLGQARAEGFRLSFRAILEEITDIYSETME